MCVKVLPALTTLFVGSPGQLLTLDGQERVAQALEASTSGKSGSHLNSELRKSSRARLYSFAADTAASTAVQLMHRSLLRPALAGLRRAKSGL